MWKKVNYPFGPCIQSAHLCQRYLCTLCKLEAFEEHNPNHHGTRYRGFALDVITHHAGVQVVPIKLIKFQGNTHSSLFEVVKSCMLV